KQGRWGQWGGVSYLSNWLPVFAFYGAEAPPGNFPPREEPPGQGGPAASGSPSSGAGPRVARATPPACTCPPGPSQGQGGERGGVSPPVREQRAGVDWRPTPFIPWHQPYFNESGHYQVRVRLPADH